MTATPTRETDMTTPIESDPASEDALKKRLLRRLVAAGVVLAGLISSLLIFDSINAPEPPPARMATAPPVSPPQATTREPVKEAPADVDKTAPPPAKADESIAERSALPDTPSMQALPGEKPLTKPVTGRLAMLRSAEPSQPAASHVEAARELARPGQSPAASGAASRPPEPRAASRPPTEVAARPFGLQLGVFTNLANAEEMRAKLAQIGIPATIEARVHAGPFASRAEADAARVKLKEHGISDSLLITMKNQGRP